MFLRLSMLEVKPGRQAPWFFTDHYGCGLKGAKLSSTVNQMLG